ncbi:hypothetical protein Q9L58_001452 [Maublancomyces gigas]|uniref:Uncharacterized protein n=1 Tax=Discina gigas TaxID=1032678 RepID=A0ABR3GU15_9PEZI
MASKLMPFGISPQEYKIHSHATNDTPTGQTSSFLKSNGLLSLGPRKHAAGEEESLDNASDTAGSGTNRKKRRVAAIPPRLYVCPWYRHNPNAQHFQVGGRFEKCRTQGVKTDKLKEHVRRVHMKPAQCPKCGRRGDPGEIRFHTEKINCTPKEVIEEVDNETLQQEILLTTRRNITWHVVFAILFPLYTPAPPEGAQYFVDEIEIVADTRPERLAQVLAAHLNSTAKTLEELLNSTEHGDDLVAPNLVAAATRLRAIISSAPFVADSRSQADPPSPGSPAQPYGDPCPDTPDWGSFIDSSQYASDKGDDSVSPTSDLK